MFDQHFGFYIGLYICGVAVAIFIHKVYFALHPELKCTNIDKSIQAQEKGDHGCLCNLDEDDDMFSPYCDQTIKIMIWFSWFSVAIWFMIVFLKVTEIVLTAFSRFFKALTDRIL